jgi:hypothetical protein
MFDAQDAVAAAVSVTLSCFGVAAVIGPVQMCLPSIAMVALSPTGPFTTMPVTERPQL